MGALVMRWLLTTPYLAEQTLRKRSEVARAGSWSVADLTAWAVARHEDGSPTANNTVRNRLSVARLFCAWLIREGILPADNGDLEDMFKHLRRRHPKVYGKRQASYPARFLTYHEAYEVLLPACTDGTWAGSKDQLLIRLGLLGLRKGEISALTWGNYQQGVILQTGKGNKVREVRPGPKLTQMLEAWRRQYEKELSRPVAGGDPIICSERGRLLEGKPGTAKSRLQPRRVKWGAPISAMSIHRAVVKVAERAGLGHVSCHDLRRSAASILHNAKGSDGGHLYDLLDIQKVLDHADPATTMRSYLDQMDKEVKSRAGGTLD